MECPLFKCPPLFILSSQNFILFVSYSFGVLLENLSFHSSEEETCVKACDVKILFDEKPIFKLQVRALPPEGVCYQ